MVQFVPDGPAFIAKAEALSRPARAVAIRHNPMQPALHALWPNCRSERSPREPVFADLYNLLLATGHTSNVTFYGRQYGLRLRDAEEPRAVAARCLGVEIDNADPQALAAAPGGHGTREACIWWTKG